MGVYCVGCLIDAQLAWQAEHWETWWYVFF